MTELFLKVADMSVSAGWVVLAVLIARFLLRKAPKWLNCALWALVAVRLVCPLSLESVFSLVPQSAPISSSAEEFQMQELPAKIQTLDFSGMDPGSVMSVQYEDEAGNSQVIEVYQDTDGTVKAIDPPKNAYLSLGDVLPWVWAGGVLLMALYAAGSYLRIRKKVQASIALGNGVYLCDYIDTPFILGIVRPKIYLPSAMDPADASHVLAHERAHLKRRDHWWKPLGYLLLAVYWFHPLLWAAYILLCRDIELACDEKVIRDMGTVEKKAYSEALLKCSVPRHMILACPLAFGEVGVKERVKSILHYKKPGFWILLVSIIIVAVVAVCFLTDPVEETAEAAEETSVLMQDTYPFETNFWTTELIYSYSGEPLYNGPSELLETINLSKVAASTVANHYQQVFEDTQLSEENFDTLFDADGQWYSKSAKKLRQENQNAWVLHDTFYGYPESIQHDFYYLLQQKNGDLYLTCGNWWDAQLRPGKTRIEWVCKLGDALVDRPFADGETPFVYTRTISTQYLDAHGWQPISIWEFSQNDVTIKEADIYLALVVDILHCVPEDAFSLGNPIEKVECVLDLNVAQSDLFDVQLRYGESKVEMRFHEDATWTFADTGEKVWLIDYEGLNEFFARYSADFVLPDYLQEPLDVHSWRKQVDVTDLEWVSVYIITPMRQNFGYNMDTLQTRDLLTQLKKLPDSAFVPTNHSPDVFKSTEAGAINFEWYHPAYAEDSDTVYASLSYLDGQVYFSFCEYSTGNHLQTWEIQDTEFVAYQAQFYDPSLPHSFHTTESATGTISVTHGDASIKLNTYEFMEYEVIDYTDDETPFGIRMKPKMLDEGWLSVLYYPGGFTPDLSWDNNITGTSNGNAVIWYKTEAQVSGSNSWTAQYYTDLPGDYVVLNDGLDVWMREFYMESHTIFEDMELAAECLTKEEILNIARSLLPDSNENAIYTKVDGILVPVDAVFDPDAKLWNITTKGQEPLLVLRIDAHGNVID